VAPHLGHVSNSVHGSKGFALNTFAEFSGTIEVPPRDRRQGGTFRQSSGGRKIKGAMAKEDIEHRDGNHYVAGSSGEVEEL
jgi:hypothetical protein